MLNNSERVAVAALRPTETHLLKKINSPNPEERLPKKLIKLDTRKRLDSALHKK